LAVGWVIDFQRASFLLVVAWARLALCTVPDTVTWITEVGVSEAEPLGQRAAVPALEVNEFIAMFLAALDADTDCLRRTLRAHKLFDLEFILCILCVASAVDHSSEVGVLAFVALVVGKLEECEVCQSAEVRIFRVL